MRGMRWLLLVAIAAILGGVVYQYRAQKSFLARNTPPTPAPLSTELSASSQHWHYRDKDLKTGRIKSDIDAESMQQVKDASRVDLKNVTMKIYGKSGGTYDLVKSAAATFNTAAVSAMVSVPWVITMRFSGTARQRSRMWARSVAVIWRLSIIMRVSISTSSRQRPSRSMSGVCVP